MTEFPKATNYTSVVGVLIDKSYPRTLINPLGPLFINLPPVKSESEIVDVLLMFVAQFIEPIICGPKVELTCYD